MSLIGDLLGLVLGIFLLLLIARLILDWIVTLSTGSPAPWALKARDFTHRFTEPVIAPVRGVLKPIRLGDIQIDLAFTVVFVMVLVLRAFVSSW
ncbi:YggT family protein [Nocardia crassostreae]|uniref:YggT family protein n=1 Tax=Nocardia crassostreae TaxID=53428 RepID=UPI00082B5B76|nr:YggT family protein [Nocardia crassostreae]